MRHSKLYHPRAVVYARHLSLIQVKILDLTPIDSDPKVFTGLLWCRRAQQVEACEWCGRDIRRSRRRRFRPAYRSQTYPLGWCFGLGRLHNDPGCRESLPQIAFVIHCAERKTQALVIPLAALSVPRKSWSAELPPNRSD